MRRIAILLAAVLGLGVAYILAHWALIEVGREVIVLRTENADGTWRENRLWIVDDGAIAWLHGADFSGWMRNLRARPIVEVERGGETHRYRAEAVPGPHPKVHELLRAKYGVADRWVRFVGRDNESTLAVRLERIDAGAGTPAAGAGNATRPRLAPAILAACGGFLLAILWIDLAFDVQVLRHRRGDAALPEPVLASIAGYYRRVTTDARPMGHLVGVVMFTALITLATQIAAGQRPRWLAPASLLLCGVPILLALARVYPNAVRLGTRSDPTPRQSTLARSICGDHLVCLAAITGFVALQLSAATE